jgi:hypothetical protein
MAKFNKSLIKLQFDFVEINGEYMNLNIMYTNKQILVLPAKEQIVEFQIDFPTEVILDISGKNMNYDTILNDDGVIIKDKHIKLTRATIDNITVPDLFLKQWPELCGNKSSYFGFNGQVKLKFLEKNSFIFLLKSLC